MKKLAISTLMGLGISTAVLAAEGGFHIVRPGETLSTIAQKWLGKPIYSHPNGSLAKLLTLNPQFEDANRIYPGQKVFLSPVTRNMKRSLASVSAEPTPAPSVAPVTLVPNTPAVVPVAVNSPAPVPSSFAAQATTDNFTPVSHLGLDLGFEYFRINSTDRATGTTAILLSNLNPALNLRWDLDWSEKWSSRVALSYSAQDVLNASSSSPSIGDGSGSALGFELGAIYRWNESSRTEFSLGSVQRVFTVSPSVSQVNVDRVQEGEIKASQEMDLARVKTISLGAGLSLYGLSPGSGSGYSTEWGWGGDASLYLRHDVSKSFQIHAGAYYGLSRQNSPLETQDETELGCTLGITGRFGE